MDHVHEVEMFIFNHQFGFSVPPMGWWSNGEDGLTEESLKTMSRYRKFTTICCAAVFALGLSACGGGDDGISVADRDAAVNDAVAAEQAKTDALQMEINALRAQLGLDPEDDPAASIQALQDEVDRLQGMIDDAADDAARMAATKTGKELFMALAGPDDGNALGYITTGPSLASSGLTINSVALKAGADAGSLGSWSGMNYAHTDAGTKVMNEAVVYTNRGASKTQSFVEKYGDNANYVASSRTLPIGADADKKIKSSAFPTAGTTTFTGAQDVAGTYDGAMGRYKCATGCSAAYETAGIALGGTWTFVHDAGAMVSNSDTNYLYYGWWVKKAKDGMPEMASAFAGRAGTEATGDGLDMAGDLAQLAGSAMYAGHAAGKFALDYSQNKLLDGASDGGHFTADVMLTAKFGSEANSGLSGTIDNFMANGESVPWSVALHRATWSTGTFAAASDGTTWSIDGTAAPKSGEWKGQMYDEMPGNPPAGDGSDVPTTVTGTFYSQFESVGRMVGAFGANKQ